MRRGEIWTAVLHSDRGADASKVHPVLIVQSDTVTEAGLPTVVVLPLTSKLRPGVRHLRIPVPARGDLELDSQIMVDQPRSIDRSRLREGPLTVLTPDEMASVERGLHLLLGTPD